MLNRVVYYKIINTFVNFQADIYLLDDPLSAVDTQVSKHIFERCLKRWSNVIYVGLPVTTSITTIKVN